MHPVHAPGYSDFFASGIRLVSRRLALESLSKRTSSPKPIPLSFDTALSDSDSEDESPKLRSRRTSIFNPLFKSKSTSGTSGSLRSSSQASKPKKHHRSASLISNIFGRRHSRQTSAAAAHVMSNDESGWLSSASSVNSVDDDIDFMDLSTWPECPRGGPECSPRATTGINSDPDLLDPFSSSPSSKSFFVGVNLPSSNPGPEDTISTPCSRTPSMSSWSNRFSFLSTSSGSSSSFFSSSRRNSLSPSLLSAETSSGSLPADTSFLHLPRMSRTNKESSVERKRPASIHVMTTTSVSSPQASIPTATTTATITTAPPIKTERRHTQIYVQNQPYLTQSHTRTRSLPLSQLPTRSSRVRSLFLNPKDLSISTPIPELGDVNETWAAHDKTGNRCGTTTTSVMSSLTIPSPVSQVPDRVPEIDDESQRVQVEVVVGPDEQEAPSSASDARVFFGSEMEDDVPKRVDWREFCIEVLDGHSDA